MRAPWASPFAASTRRSRRKKKSLLKILLPDAKFRLSVALVTWLEAWEWEWAWTAKKTRMVS